MCLGRSVWLHRNFSLNISPFSTSICQLLTKLRSGVSLKEQKSKNTRDIFEVVEMSASAVNAGALVTLRELNPSSPNFKQGGAFRVTGKLQEYTLETAVAVIIDGDASLKVDTQHLKLNLRPGSLYQFIGELHIEPTNEAILKARVGRNVDGLDLNLYHQSMQLLREFQAAQISSWTA